MAVAIITDRQMLNALEVDLDGRLQVAVDNEDLPRQDAIEGLLAALNGASPPDGTPSLWPICVVLTNEQVDQLAISLEQVDELRTDADEAEDYIFMPDLRCILAR